MKGLYEVGMMRRQDVAMWSEIRNEGEKDESTRYIRPPEQVKQWAVNMLLIEWGIAGAEFQ
jgi:hypothetical protein